MLRICLSLALGMGKDAEVKEKETDWGGKKVMFPMEGMGLKRNKYIYINMRICILLWVNDGVYRPKSTLRNGH